MDSKALVKKLYIKPTFRFGVFDAPEADFQKLKSQLPENEVVSKLSGKFDLFLLYVNNKEDLYEKFPSTITSLKDNRQFWIAYPKLIGEVTSDFNRDIIREYVQSLGFEGISLVSIDKTWSGMRFKRSRM